jgi:hypothetical protein
LRINILQEIFNCGLKVLTLWQKEDDDSTVVNPLLLLTVSCLPQGKIITVTG